jgi:hypothetical protein
MKLFNKIVFVCLLITITLASTAYAINQLEWSLVAFSVVLLFLFDWIFTITLAKINSIFKHSILTFAAIFVILFLTVLLRIMLIDYILIILFIVASIYNLIKFIKQNKKVKPKAAIKGNDLKEFEGLENFLKIGSFSVLLMSFGAYGATIYASTLRGYLIGFVIFLIGVIAYLFDNSGRSALFGLIKNYWNFKIRVGNKNQQDLNVHLSLAWFIVFITIIFTCFIYNDFVKSNSTNINLDIFSNAAESIIVVDSIFAGLIVILAERVKIKTITFLFPMIASIFFSFIIFELVAFNAPLAFLLTILNLSFLLMYSSYSILLLYLKKAFKSKRDA